MLHRGRLIGNGDGRRGAQTGRIADDRRCRRRDCGDPVWRLPLWQPYRRHLKSRTADLTNAPDSPFAGAILAEASLSFLGLGIQPPTPSWGAMINAGRSHLLDAPHLTLVPGLAIVFAVVALNFLGDALVDRLDPRRRTLSDR